MSKSTKRLTISDKILIGAVVLSDEDTNKKFTFQDLVISTWKEDQNTFGLRGYEEKYPDSHKIHPYVYGGTALIASGYLKNNEEGLLSLTQAGVVKGLTLSSIQKNTKPRLPKNLQDAILNMLGNKIFNTWLDDPSKPKKFRDAGYFWGISPGTPSKAVRKRIGLIEKKLEETINFMEVNNLDYVTDDRYQGKPIFDKEDVLRCLEFHNQLKERFNKELKMLDPDGNY